jgi:glutamine synthetase
MICDVCLPDGSPFPGCPRTALKKVVKEADDFGFKLMVGTEVEFFLFLRGEDGRATSITHDAGGYFDLAPIDRGEEARRDMVSHLPLPGPEDCYGQRTPRNLYAQTLLRAERIGSAFLSSPV